MKINMRKSIVLFMFWVSATLACASPTAKDLISAAPVFQLLLDNSGSSPATDQNFINSSWPIIEGKLRSMPMGSVIVINTVGDASLAALMKRTRIQKISSAEGASMEDIIRLVKSIVLNFPKRVQGAEHGQSHLIGGLFDASKNINESASSKNVIVMLSDLIEFSPIANCYKHPSCPLPKPMFRLENTEFVGLGVGRGLPSNREMAIFSAWESFLDKTGAKYDLRKTF